MDGGQIAAVRRFNRTVTAAAGALTDAYLDEDLSLGAARVLWELARLVDTEGGAPVALRLVRDELDLDPGYLSRVVARLAAAGLLASAVDPTDARRRLVAPTDAGRARIEVYDRRSDALAAGRLAPLTAGARARLVAAMGEVERLLAASSVAIDEVDPETDDAQHCLRAYYAELDERFDVGFDVTASLPVRPEEVRPPAGVMLLACEHGRAIGCGSLKFHGEAPAEIKRLWVDRAARGLGVGRRLMDELENRARAAGCRAVRLDTNASLVEAIAMYRARGYVEIPPFTDEPYADYWFEKRLD
ncbi:MAG: MarR family transcriptional regulator [Actinomycetales bacterium]|nr:MarR family transcriptional regulator [Actinomycetales bacterium]